MAVGAGPGGGTSKSAGAGRVKQSLLLKQDKKNKTENPSSAVLTHEPYTYTSFQHFFAILGKTWWG
jgi:hypothetical protein